MPQIIFLFNINNTSIPYQPICGYKYPDRQCRSCCVKIPMNTSPMVNVTTMQRRRCCAFDSPGLARNEPTSGNQNKLHLPTLTFKEELQYTDYALCFYEKNMYICTKQFIKVWATSGKRCWTWPQNRLEPIRKIKLINFQKQIKHETKELLFTRTLFAMCKSSGFRRR